MLCYYCHGPHPLAHAALLLLTSSRSSPHLELLRIVSICSSYPSCKVHLQCHLSCVAFLDPTPSSKLYLYVSYRTHLPAPGIVFICVFEHLPNQRRHEKRTCVGASLCISLCFYLSSTTFELSDFGVWVLYLESGCGPRLSHDMAARMLAQNTHALIRCLTLPPGTYQVRDQQ